MPGGCLTDVFAGLKMIGRKHTHAVSVPAHDALLTLEKGWRLVLYLQQLQS